MQGCSRRLVVPVLKSCDRWPCALLLPSASHIELVGHIFALVDG